MAQAAFEKDDLSRFQNDTAEAVNLPAYLYTSQDVYQAELERIFYRKWLCVSRVDQLPRPGDVMLRKVGDRPIMIARAKDGKLGAFYNVCRHRGARLVKESCNTSVVQCPYHGWTFGLDGRLVGAPDMEETVGFEKEDYPLYPVKLEVWGGFIWVNLDPDSEPLSSYLGDFTKEFEHYGFQDLRYVNTVGTYEVKANWKAFMENANECYHCFTVHPQTQKFTPYHDLVWDRYGPQQEKVRGPYTVYYYEGKEEGARNVFGPGWPSEFGEGKPAISGLSPQDASCIYFPQLFPNLVLSLTPDYVAIIYVWPDGPGKTTAVADLLFPKSLVEKNVDPGIINQAYDLVNKQDIEIVEAVQVGLQSGVYTPGRYSVLEVPVHRFQKLYVESMKHVA